MSHIPKFRIYDTDGNTLLYTFTAVQDANYPRSERELIEHTSQRATGSLIVDGGSKAWDLFIRFIISGKDYEELTQKIDELESIITLNTPLILKIDKTSVTAYSYKVKRILPIEYPMGEDRRVNYQEINIIFRANSW